jgi:hypothetical protein
MLITGLEGSGGELKGLSGIPGDHRGSEYTGIEISPGFETEDCFCKGYE